MTTCITVTVLLCSVSMVVTAHIPLAKCCPSGEFYDLGNNVCSETIDNSTLGDWLPPVHSNESVILNAEHFQLTESFNFCPDGFVAQSSTEFTLFADGSINVRNVSSDIELFCVDKILTKGTNDGKFAARFCVPDNCKESICVRKCCPLGFKMSEETSLCVPSTKEFLLEFRNESGHVVDEPVEYVIQSGIYPNCPDGMTILDPAFDQHDTFYLLKSGFIYSPMYDYDNFIKAYCVEDFGDETTSERKALICLEPAHDHILVMKIFAHLMFFSSIFLIATFVIYAIIPEIRNVNGVTVMCHCASLAVAFICLGIIQLTPDLSQGPCHITAIITHFGFLSAFCWLNVMSFDIWWTIGRRSRSSNRRSNRRLLFYSIYSWGVPLTIVAVGQILDHIPDIPDHIVRPKFAVLSCWFTDDSATWAYFYGPIAAILICNLVFFILTTIRLQCAGSDAAATSPSRKKKFLITVSLFLLMGVTWTTEIISGAIKGSLFYSLPTDILNIMTGVFIFVFFVCKRKVRKLLKKKFQRQRHPNQREEHFTMTEMCHTDTLLT